MIFGAPIDPYSRHRCLSRSCFDGWLSDPKQALGAALLAKPVDSGPQRITQYILSSTAQAGYASWLGASHDFKAEGIAMGAWSHEPFGNDDANDWAYELEEAKDLSYIEAALDAVLETDGYLEAPESSCAVAAVEVISKLRGKGTQTDAYTEKVDEWVKNMRVKPTRPLLEKARRALERIRGEQSELKELWHEGDAAEWDASINALYAAVTA